MRTVDNLGPWAITNNNTARTKVLQIARLLLCELCDRYFTALIKYVLGVVGPLSTRDISYLSLANKLLSNC
jgi:hypothetical protein